MLNIHISRVLSLPILNLNRPMSHPTTSEELKPLLAYFYQWEKQRAHEIYLKQPFGDSFRDFTWAEVGDQARRMATYLQSLGLPPQSNIGLVSKNCAEWIIADLAILMAGHVSTPFYPTLTDTQIHQVLSHSGCPVLFVGKLDNWAGMKGGIEDHIRCISFPTIIPTLSMCSGTIFYGSMSHYKVSLCPSSPTYLVSFIRQGLRVHPKG